MSKARIIRKLPDAPPYHRPEISKRVYGYKPKHIRVLDHEPKPSPALAERHPKANTKWTDDKLRELAEMYDGGVDMVTIGAHFNYTAGAITKYITKARAKGFIKTTRHSRQEWTEEENNILRTMRANGIAFDVIAKRLGRSRNSVMARAKKMRKGVMK